MRILFIVFICFLSFSNSIAQEKIEKTMLLADLDSLVSWIDQIHPDMYASIGKEKFNMELEKTRSKITGDMTAIDFYSIVSPLVSSLGDGHTMMHFPYMELKNSSDLFFPVTVTINTNDSTVFVDECLVKGENEIPSGSKIISINKVPIKDIETEMMKYCSGEQYFFKLSIAEYYFTPLLYTIYRKDEFDVEYLENGVLQSKKINGIGAEERFFTRQNSVKRKMDYYYSFKILPDENVGVIDFVSFVDLKKFKHFLDSVFTIVNEKNIQNIIIDIRRNGGGNSALGDEFFQYISHVPFSQFGKTMVKYSDRQHDFYESKKSVRKKQPNGIHTHEADSTNLIKLRKSKLRFNGQVYLLTSHYSFSSAADFAGAFQHFKMGTIVGEETGGLKVCFGDVISQQLPNTKLFFGVSFKKFYLYGANDSDTHGVIPDIIVPADKAMDQTLKLIREKTGNE